MFCKNCGSVIKDSQKFCANCGFKVNPKNSSGSDLPKGQKSGLTEAVKILNGIKGIEILKLDAVDIVRHSVVSKIIKAYEKL